ncbi:PREDICTED: double-stranded RNA-specific editase 1-like [Poecilia mexicana]|uniref:double-stranded RNA-specific editase 1-like n=1 Tax=Poecilia mexicana TaxID=48701 RepID=UPI00072E9B5C|nr:PREDICTED: double-stranded RNA-specific editase 1-like [Poecilia mexicana]
MAPAQETCRSMQRSDGDVSRRSGRKRRRKSRRKAKGWSDLVSTLNRPLKRRETAANPAEAAEKSRETSLEVKENRGVIGISDFFSRYQPSAVCAASSKHEQRNPPFLFGKGRSCFQKPSCCKTSAWTESQRNAVVQLNQLRPGLQYEVVSERGPLHAPLFSVGVEVDGFHFEGQGTSKKQARMKAAELALQSFIQFPNFSQTHTVKETFDFTADSFLAEFEPSLLENCDFLHNKTAKTEMFPNVNKNRKTHHFTLDLVSSASPKRQLSPVAMLNELRPGLRYLCQVERVHGTPVRNFIMVVRLEGKVFEGCAHSKNQAKIQAAAAALQALYSMNLEPERKLISLHGGRTKCQLPQFFVESIYHLVREKYSQLSDGCSSSSPGRHKVLAGIVMTRGFDLGSAQVVSLATGTKCLDSDRLKEDGWTLRDCHAEVLSRRALVRFFYSQLELLLCERTVGQDPSIFVPDKDSTHRFRLQEGIRFHMYVSLSPCGDARLNCPYKTTPAYPSRRFRCHLRMKVNGGEGTLPLVSTRTNQKWAGVSLGQHVCMASMSCTDKIAKWSVVGLQGALLSHLVEPIYLHSLTVGRLSHTGHLGRAVTRRLARVKHLPSLYRRQQLLLGCLSSTEVCPAGRAGDVCVNWSFGERTLEEINISTGRSKDSGSASRICRRFLFSCWLRLENKLNTPVLGPGATTMTYPASKMAARRYQRAMQQFSNALQDAGLGLWPRKLM